MASKRHERLPLTDEAGEVRELTDEDFAQMRPMRDVAPDLVAAFERLRASQNVSTSTASPDEERVEIDLDRTVLDHFRAGGPDWAERMAHVLTMHVRSAGGS